MTEVKIKVEFEVGEEEDSSIKKSIHQKFSEKTIPFETVPRIGEWLDLLEVSKEYDLSEEQLNWLSNADHKFQIEDVHKCDGYFEIELDTDKIWSHEGQDN